MPRTIQVGKRNSTFQVLESLRTNRQKRHRSRTFLVEGVQPITLALRHGWTFEAVAYESGAPLSDWARDVVARAAADRYELAGDLLRALSGRDEGSELLAVLRMPAGGIERIAIPGNLLAAVMDRPASPGNLGTLIRSCDAFGVHGLIVTGHGVDVYDPATIAASRGSLFALPVVQADSHAGIGRWLGALRQTLGNCQLAGADEGAPVDLAEVDLAMPTVIVLGNETHGMSRAYREMCDTLVRIPMSGSASSLNVAVAASIFFYEAVRQRRGTKGSERPRYGTTSSGSGTNRPPASFQAVTSGRTGSASDTISQTNSG